MDRPTSARRALTITPWLDHACLDTCSDGCFHDINDDLCKPVACEYGDVVLTADSSGWVVSDDSWRYVAKGVITAVSPSSGHHNTDVVLTSSTGSTVTAEGGFEYVAAASVDAISPANGQVGTKTTITAF